MRRFYEMWEGHSTIAPSEIYAADYVDHMPHPGRTFLEGVEIAVKRFRTAFPDSKFRIELLLCKGDYAVGTAVFSGTHTGPLNDIGPTGRKVEISTIDIARIASGKIAEIWHLEDELQLMIHLGMMPRPRD